MGHSFGRYQQVDHNKKIDWARLKIPKYVPFGFKDKAAFFLNEAAKSQPILSDLANTPGIGFDSLLFAPEENPGDLLAVCSVAAHITRFLPNIFGMPCGSRAAAESRFDQIKTLVDGYMIALMPEEWLSGARMNDRKCIDRISAAIHIVATNYSAWAFGYDASRPEHKIIASKYRIKPENVETNICADVIYSVEYGIQYAACGTYARAGNDLAMQIGVKCEYFRVKVASSQVNHGICRINKFSESKELPYFSDPTHLRSVVARAWNQRGATGRLRKIPEEFTHHLITDLIGFPYILNYLILCSKYIDEFPKKASDVDGLPNMSRHYNDILSIQLKVNPWIFGYCDAVRRVVGRQLLFRSGLDLDEAKDLIQQNGGGALPGSTSSEAMKYRKTSPIAK